MPPSRPSQRGSDGRPEHLADGLRGHVYPADGANAPRKLGRGIVGRSKGSCGGSSGGCVADRDEQHTHGRARERMDGIGSEREGHGGSIDKSTEE